MNSGQQIAYGLYNNARNLWLWVAQSLVPPLPVPVQPSGSTGGSGTSPTGPGAPYLAPLNFQCKTGYHLQAVDMGGYGIPHIVYWCYPDSGGNLPPGTV